MKHLLTLTKLSLLGAVLGFIACTDTASKLPDYGTVPPFRMTDSRGETFDSSALNGKVWIVDFIYTNCPAACPLMTSKMHALEKRIRNDDDVRLVSISVDPARDTPAALTAFAHHYGGPTPQWMFLTGAPNTVHLLAYTTFHVGDVLGKIEHSTKFMLVDKRGRIRGYYSTLSSNDGQAEDDMNALLRDIGLLRREEA